MENSAIRKCSVLYYNVDHAQEVYDINCVKCPYTDPPLVHKDKSKTNWGYVFYDAYFGNGKKPQKD